MNHTTKPHDNDNPMEREPSFLHESDPKTNALFSAMNELVVLHELVFDEQGKPVNYRITDCNAAYTKTTGITRENAIGRLATDVYGTEEPPYLDVYAQVAITGEPHVYETYFPPMDKYFLISVVSPEKNSFATVTTDITGQKLAEIRLQESEERFDRAIAGTGAGLWDWDMVKNTVYFSPRWKSMLGYEDHEIPNDFSGWTCLWHPEEAAGIEAVMQDFLAGKTAVYEVEHRLLRKDGNWQWILTRGDIIKDSTGKPIRWTGTNIDIHDRKIAEEALKIAKEHAESASKAKSQFLANMSHEIRTPLNGVIGFTELLMNTPLTPMQQQYASNAHFSGNMLLGIINDILDFSKIEAGMMNLEIIRTDMVELLENSVDVIKHTAERKKLEVLLNMDLSMPRFAMVDPVRLQQILGNLLGNAVKFTEKGEVELKVSYEAGSGAQGTYQFSVRDTGIGISKSQMERLFKAFSQADGSTTRKFGGTGLGLVISDLLAREMASKIHMDSSPGEGSLFHFNLTTDILEEEQAGIRTVEGIHRCLIVDDNANNRMILEHSLATWHIETESCDNGLSALKLLEDARPFDVVICDYHMPYIDGLETIRLMREKLGLGRQPVFLLHSSSDDAALHRKCEALGIRFRLTKPVKLKELHHALSSLQVNPEPPSPLSASADTTDVSGTESLQVPDHVSEQGKVTILVADDVHMNMMVIKALIHRLLPEAILLEAENGVKAVELFQKTRPDLILMDVQMPEMDGIEATKIIRSIRREDGYQVPIVALSAGVLKEEKERCLAAGMDDFLAKPLAMDKLKALFERMPGPFQQNV